MNFYGILGSIWIFHISQVLSNFVEMKLTTWTMELCVTAFKVYLKIKTICI